MANRDNDNGMNQWMNNPFAYIMFMAMFGNGFGWGNRGNQLQDAEIQSKLNQLSTQLQDGNNTNLLLPDTAEHNMLLVFCLIKHKLKRQDAQLREKMTNLQRKY